MATKEATRIEEKKEEKCPPGYIQVIQMDEDYIYDPVGRFKDEKSRYIKDYTDIGLGNGMSKEKAENLAEKIFQEYSVDIVMEMIGKEEKYGECWPEHVWLDLMERVYDRDKQGRRDMRKYRFYCVECGEWKKKLWVCKGCREGPRLCSKHCQKKVRKRSHRFECDKRHIVDI